MEYLENNKAPQLQIGFTQDALEIYRREDNLEHDAQAELAKRPAQTSLGDMRAYIPKGRARACSEPQDRDTKASSTSGGPAARSTKELEENVARWDAYLQVYTKHLGEGKLPDGTYLNDVLGVRGIAARLHLQS